MQIVIIGNGIAGITAALTIRKLQPDYAITVISSESARFFSRTALMYAFMGQIKYQHLYPFEECFWKDNNLNLIHDEVVEIDSASQKIRLKSGIFLSYDNLLLATGSKPAMHNWPGQDLKGVQGFYSMQDLELLEERAKSCKQAVIVGGGLIGVELAEMLHSRQIPVTLLVRESHYWGKYLPAEEGHIIVNHLKAHKINVLLETELAEISSDLDGNVSGIKTTTGLQITCDLVCIATGVKPNIKLAKSSGIKTDKGILVNEFLETGIPGIYAAGDCAEILEPAGVQSTVEQLWYTGRMQGETVAYTICGQKIKYDRGIWFNSAKFFQLEYQTYGKIANTLPDHEETLFWQNGKENKSIRINYTKENKAVSGFNLIGIRYRQEVCEKWIKNRTTIREVMATLHLANFDPEFSKPYEQQLILEFNNRYPENPVAINKKKSQFRFFF